MDIALLLDASVDADDGRGGLLKPFGDSSLLEIALEKLSGLDAPCRRYLCTDRREFREVAQRFGNLKILRRNTRSGPPESLAGRFSYLANLPERHFLLVNPHWPLIDAECWWDAVEHFLAMQAGGLVSASRLEGRFHDDEMPILASTPAVGSILVENDAFRVISKRGIFDAGTLFDKSSETLIHEIPRENCWRVTTPQEFHAAEAVWSTRRLCVPLPR